MDIIGYKPSTQGHSLQIRKAIEAIKSSNRPVICAGGGVFRQKPAVNSGSSPSSAIYLLYPHDGDRRPAVEHRLNMGMLGSHGCVPANKAIRDADLVILAGARVGDRAVAAPGQVAERATIIHIDIDPAEIGKNMPAHIPIVGDLKLVLAEFIRNCIWEAPQEWVQQVTGRKARYFEPNTQPVEGFVEPKLFIRALSRKMRSDSILCADVGQNQIWSANNF